MYLAFHILYGDYRRSVNVRMCVYEVLQILAEGGIARACLRSKACLFALLVDVVDSAAQWTGLVALVIQVACLLVPSVKVGYLVLTVGQLAHELTIEVVQIQMVVVVALALQYGKLKESDWTYGKIITGEVTAAFTEMLCSQPKPTDIEAANKMTPFFNIFLDDTFQSSHWGTEIYYGG